jgi:hypothetical protein
MRVWWVRRSRTGGAPGVSATCLIPRYSARIDESGAASSQAVKTSRNLIILLTKLPNASPCRARSTATFQRPSPCSLRRIRPSKSVLLVAKGSLHQHGLCLAVWARPRKPFSTPFPKTGLRFVVSWKGGTGKDSKWFARGFHVGRCGPLSVLWKWNLDQEPSGERRRSGRRKPRRGRRSNGERGPSGKRRPRWERGPGERQQLHSR